MRVKCGSVLGADFAEVPGARGHGRAHRVHRARGALIASFWVVGRTVAASSAGVPSWAVMVLIVSLVGVLVLVLGAGVACYCGYDRFIRARLQAKAVHPRHADKKRKKLKYRDPPPSPPQGWPALGPVAAEVPTQGEATRV